MKLTDLWYRLEETFGPAYAASVARDQVFTQLDGRTINEALARFTSVPTRCIRATGLLRNPYK